VLPAKQGSWNLFPDLFGGSQKSAEKEKAIDFSLLGGDSKKSGSGAKEAGAQGAIRNVVVHNSPTIHLHLSGGVEGNKQKIKELLIEMMVESTHDAEIMLSQE
jgi:hypothetical protein